MPPPATSLTDKEPYSVVVAVFLREKAAELSPYSVAHLRASLLPLGRALADPPLSAVVYTDLRAYVDALHLRYAPGTIKPTIGDIRQFFRWAKKRGYLAANPAKRLRLPSGRVMALGNRGKAPPETAVQRLLTDLAGRLVRVVYRDLFGNLCAFVRSEWRYAEQETLRDLFILSFLYETGCRAGELWRLSSRGMEDAVMRPTPAFHVVTTGKTGETSLWFTRATAELWTVWQTVRPAGSEQYAVVAWRPNGDPTPMTTPTISRMLVRRCQRAGVTPFRAHALRHAKIQRGRQVVGLETVSRLIGHGSAVTTAGYGLIGEDELQAAALATGLQYRFWA